MRAMNKAKYKVGDKVRFSHPTMVSWGGEVIREEGVMDGTVEIVDAYGTFEQHEEPSYDIYNKENNVLFKHCRESTIVEYLGEASEKERLFWYGRFPEIHSTD